MLPLAVKFLTSKPMLSVPTWIILFVWITFWPVGAHATNQPTQIKPWPSEWSYRLQAQISGMRFGINARMEWSVVQDRYQAKLRYSLPLLGHRTQTSHGVWSDQGLLPDVFVESTSRRETELAFDWKGKTVKRNQAPFHQPLQKGAQDPLSIFFETGLKLAQLPAHQNPPASMTVNVVGTRRVEDWTFNFVGFETLNLPAGPYPTMHWQRPASADDKGVTADIWFAPSLGFMPVRIRLSQANGDVLDQQLLDLKSSP